MLNTIDLAYWLPVIFAALMVISMFAYVILDGYDLGVGILLEFEKDTQEKDKMIASIGPFWDANETWLVLGVGLLLVAFPLAHGVILGALYLPVALMLLGLILRGVAFDFRVKAKAHHQAMWNTLFFAGSLLAAVSQGVMLGRYITGFAPGWGAWGFALLVGASLAAAYALLGAGWLMMKSTGPLQQRAVRWAQGSLWLAALATILVSIATPWISPRVFALWFSMPNIVLLAPVPIFTAALFAVIAYALPKLAARQQQGNDNFCWLPFAATVGIVVLAFFGLVYSIFPHLVIDQLTIWQAASSPEALLIMLFGAALVLPTIIGYTIYSYRVFWGKASELSYQ
ncbi:cytochrome d ubiquinol oxidase subunit II [Chitinibacter bivalviorum]|uniref:Cytochrome d ubiquinol oxidase subunit II n=1 Tax=Chitinibacter bivalviorum TaxID=2739434 RepID=A0A7H9BFT0_9NEIS|nr:cytochrome d ubiquinol oxidase subunit II [Chitinibacter bivalviorum]QLG87435.1 cytochrome d ubiquinol oxidase subunit II [Chitinibacter bivalviorum]